MIMNILNNGNILGCGEPNVPGVYAKLTNKNVLEWINEETGGCANNDDSGTETTTNGTETTTENSCQDNWKESKCKRLKKKGKCGKFRVRKNCQKTCDLC